MRLFTVCAVLPLLCLPLETQAQSEAADLEKASKATQQEFRKQWCSLARAAGLPIRISPTALSEARKEVGEARIRQLFLPVARTNNAYWCFCLDGEARAKYKCGPRG